MSFNRKVNKKCRYGCETEIYWDNRETGKLKWVETNSGILHDYKRCAEILKRQGKSLKK